MNNDLKFFTNEADSSLLDRFKKILENDTQFFDVLVGYFRSSGFYQLYPSLKDVEKIRILVGLNIDKVTIKERSGVEVWAHIPLPSIQKLGYEPISRHRRAT